MPPSTSMPTVVAACVDHPRDFGDLRLHRRDVLLSAPARVHGHHEDLVDEVEHVGDGRRGGRGVDRHGCPGAEVAHGAERAVQVSSGLGVHDEGLAASLEHRPQHLLGRVDHEVGLERQADLGPDGADHVGAERDHRHELAVHHVELHAVASRLLELDDALGEPALIDWQHRGDDGDRLHDATLRRTARPYARPVLQLRPTAMAAGGAALARDDNGRVVFIEGALPGELVGAEVFEEHVDYAKATVASVEEAAPGRVAPPCPYVAAGCGGCGWQHVDPVVQVELKRDIVVDALRRIGRLANPVVAVAPALPSTGYRTTVRMGVRAGRAGFRAHRSHDLVDIDACLVADPLLADLIRDGRYGDAAR